MMKIDGIEIKDNLDILVILGPTASGKTALSIKLAKELNGEISNGDAFQVYRDMNIGTAKIKEEEKEGVPHHLIDIVDYKDEFNVKIFQKMLREKVETIKNKGKLPIICGGTGLYIQAGLYNYEFKEFSYLKICATY